MKIEEILVIDEGPARTAALVGWIQGLFDDDGTVPVLVGGAAVELYTLGAYTTGDVDLVGSVARGVARILEEAGFERHGRHWIQEQAQVFVEFPGDALGPDEAALWLELEGQRVRIISVEDLLVDRLGAWEYWQSSVDGVNALLVWRAQKERIDVKRLEQRVAQAGWHKAWQSLVQFTERWASGEPPVEEVERWANAGP
jgi:hypothetical protein